MLLGVLDVFHGAGSIVDLHGGDGRLFVGQMRVIPRTSVVGGNEHSRDVIPSNIDLRLKNTRRGTLGYWTEREAIGLDTFEFQFPRRKTCVLHHVPAVGLDVLPHVVVRVIHSLANSHVEGPMFGSLVLVERLRILDFLGVVKVVVVERES